MKVQGEKSKKKKGTQLSSDLIYLINGGIIFFLPQITQIKDNISPS